MIFNASRLTMMDVIALIEHHFNTPVPETIEQIALETGLNLEIPLRGSVEPQEPR